MAASARALKPTRVLKTIGTVKTVIEKIDSQLKLQHYKVKSFEPHVGFRIERGHYVVKTAEGGADLEKCLRLRFDVFHLEFMKKNRTIGVDIDKLDFLCDHLMIVDKRTDKVIGTYRMNCSRFTETFYSESEFHLRKMLEIPGHKVELGRACIHKDFRNGAVIALLWRGIAEYIQKTESVLLFGCSSVKTMDPFQTGLLTKYLTDGGHLTHDYECEPTKKYKLKQLGKVLEYIDAHPYEYHQDEIEAMVPALFRSYLNLGAKILGDPALDRDFGCIDFLTLLRMDAMSPIMREKYGL